MGARTANSTQWLEIVITEGRNRQVRRMTAAVGHPTLRLVRVKIGNWTLEGIEPGKYKVETINLPKAQGKPQGRANAASGTKTGSSGKPKAGSAPSSGTTNASAQTKANPGQGRTTRNEKSKASASNGRGKAAGNAAKPTTQTLVIQKPKPKIPRDPN
jgi:23S rRNA pseudouridine2457 synthase